MCELSLHGFSSFSQQVLCSSFVSVLRIEVILDFLRYSLQIFFPNLLAVSKPYGVFVMQIKYYIVKSVIFSLLNFIFGVTVRKLFPIPNLKRNSPTFPSRNYTVSSFTCRSLIHLELVLVYSVSYKCNFIFSKCLPSFPNMIY